MKRALFALCVAIATTAARGQDETGHTICYHRVCHVHCYFGGGKQMTTDTDPTKYFSNSPPSVVFFETNGTFHSIIGNCDVTCNP